MQLIVRSGVNGLLVPVEDDEAYPEHFRAVLLGKAFWPGALLRPLRRRVR
jgi:hypothetical protein